MSNLIFNQVTIPDIFKFHGHKFHVLFGNDSDMKENRKLVVDEWVAADVRIRPDGFLEIDFQEGITVKSGQTLEIDPIQIENPDKIHIYIWEDENGS